MTATLYAPRNFTRAASASPAMRRAPRPIPMDLYRDGDRFVLSADLPGIDPRSVDIDVDGRLLSIRAERAVATDADVQWVTRERAAGSFQRQFTLGQGVDSEHIAATYDNGVLTLTIPVSEKAKARKIQVASTKAADVSAPADGAPADVTTPEVDAQKADSQKADAPAAA